MIRAEITLILELQGTEWWEGVTPAMLETVRRRLRGLMKLIEKSRRKPIYSDFEDEIGEGATIELPGFSAPHSFERFREKAQAFLREHQDHIAIQKLRTNEPLTPTDLKELERMLSESGVAEPGDLEKAKMQSEGSLGLFVRSLVGLDREAAKKALGGFASGQNLSAAQIEFVNLIVDQLTERGVMPAELLYESPFTDINPKGPEGVFEAALVDELVHLLADVRKRAVA